MRIPMAFRWLAMGVLGWIGLRGPIVAHDFAAFRASLALPAGTHDTYAQATTSPHFPYAGTVSVNVAALQPRQAIARTIPTSTPANTVVLDLPPLPPPPSPEPGGTATPDPAQGAWLAEQGYQRLRQGDRKGAAALLAAATAEAVGDPRAAIWAADRRMLTARWSGDSYVLARQGGTSRLLGATPTLGGSQAGARLAYVLNPLSDQRVTLAGRTFQPLARHSGGSKAAQAILGLEFQPSRKLPVVIAVDRYVALGAQARDAWALRLSGGAEGLLIGQGLEASFYGQAGIIGVHSRDRYADGWAKVHRAMLERDRVRTLVGIGVWAGAQPGAARVDVGPSAEISGKLGATRVAASVDYRIRAAGNARPGNGPAVTVRAGF